MKKIMRTIAVAISVISVVSLFSACGDNGEEQAEHDTNYASYVSVSEIGHCGVYSDGRIDSAYAYAHVWKDGQCTLCGYKNVVADTEPDDNPPDEGTDVENVGKIEVETNPDKMKYWIGEEVDVTGGTIKVTYKDNTTEIISMHDEIVVISDVKTNSAGRKTVTVNVGDRKTTFTITVREKGQSVTFDYNYQGAPQPYVATAPKNGSADVPEDPVREGYTFYKWYVDAACTIEYDFDKIVDKPITLYADWQENGATYYEVTYDLNYYGVALQTYKQSVKSGEAARPLGLTVTRDEFSFEGWYADAECLTAYDQSSAVSQDTTIYAKWNKTKVGSSQYLFEAEFTNLDGKEGPGLSGSAAGKAMIINDVKSLGASGGKYISYLYKEGLSVDFELACSEDVDDATLTVRLSTEFDFELTDEIYAIEVNGERLAFDPVYLTSGMYYSDAVVIEGVHLKKGANVIKLITANSINPAGEGMGTYRGTAPTIDCIKIDTDAVVTWDGSKGFPKDNT